MDSCTTVEEVKLALRKKLQTYEGKLEVRLTRPNAAGQRMAVFSIEEEAAACFLESARICIVWISCRLRRREQVTRCFRCFGYGHEIRACKGPNRSNQCYRCGSEEHKAADCLASPSASCAQVTHCVTLRGRSFEKPLPNTAASNEGSAGEPE